MTRPDPDPHRAPVLPLRPSAAGGPSTRGPAIVSIVDLGGRRLSTIRRGDGTTFTVTVPAEGIDAPEHALRPSRPWIRDHGGGRRVPAVALEGLAARVGMRLVPVHPSGS